jgi:MFS transporter, DHA2 family, multidrug resistance protein
MTGWLARVFGRKRLLLAAVIGFAAASFLCGLAMNLPMLIVFRTVQGPTGGWLTDNYSWRWIFYINLPIGLASVVMIKLFIFDPPYLRRIRGKIDVLGISSLAI